MAGLADFVDEDSGGEEETLHLMQIEYEEDYGDPIVHLWGRTRDGVERHVEVVGHHPSFYIHEDAFSRRIINHDWGMWC